MFPNSTGGHELFAVARITKTRGLRGELKVTMLTDFPERFAHTSEVHLQLYDGRILPANVDHHWFQQGQLVLKFAGFDTIEQAQTLVGALVMVREEDLVDLDPDEFFHFQLLDCEVVNMAGHRIGRVAKIIETGSAPLLLVKDDLGREHLIPFARAICPEIDLEARRIRIDPPEGLLDL